MKIVFRYSVITILMTIYLSLCHPASPAIGSTGLTFDNLIQDSDLIVVGTILKNNEDGYATLEVEKCLKGTTASQLVLIRSTPLLICGDSTHVEENEKGLWFLLGPSKKQPTASPKYLIASFGRGRMPFFRFDERDCVLSYLEEPGSVKFPRKIKYQSVNRDQYGLLVRYVGVELEQYIREKVKQKQA